MTNATIFMKSEQIDIKYYDIFVTNDGLGRHNSFPHRHERVHFWSRRATPIIPGRYESGNVNFGVRFGISRHRRTRDVTDDGWRTASLLRWLINMQGIKALNEVGWLGFIAAVAAVRQTPTTLSSLRIEFRTTLFLGLLAALHLFLRRRSVIRTGALLVVEFARTRVAGQLARQEPVAHQKHAYAFVLYLGRRWNAFGVGHGTADQVRLTLTQSFHLGNEGTGHLVRCRQIIVATLQQINFQRACHSSIHSTIMNVKLFSPKIISDYILPPSTNSLPVQIHQKISTATCQNAWTWSFVDVTLHPIFWFEKGQSKVQSKVQVFDTPQVVDCFKVESDAALLPSWFNW